MARIVNKELISGAPRVNPWIPIHDPHSFMLRYGSSVRRDVDIAVNQMMLALFLASMRGLLCRRMKQMPLVIQHEPGFVKVWQAAFGGVASGHGKPGMPFANTEGLAAVAMPVSAP